jgi:hypothetical protein
MLRFSDSDGFAERSLNLSVVGTNSREEHTPEPVQFGTPTALVETPCRIFLKQFLKENCDRLRNIFESLKR